jgi:hypothetical protein
VGVSRGSEVQETKARGRPGTGQGIFPYTQVGVGIADRALSGLNPPITDFRRHRRRPFLHRTGPWIVYLILWRISRISIPVGRS